MAKGNAGDRASKQTKKAKNGVDQSQITKCPIKGKQPRKYYGEQAIKEVEKREGLLSYKEKRIVILEGYVDGVYCDTNNIPTSGVGQTKEYMNMSVKDSIAKHEDIVRNLIPSYNKLPQYLQVELLQATYRGDLGDSPKFRKLFNQGKYEEAAAEFLNHDDYKNTTKRQIKERIQAVNDAVLKYDEKNNINNIDKFSELVKGIQAAHSDWTQEDIVSQLRRSIPEYTDIQWAIAMPFNSFPSDLEDKFKTDFNNIIENMKKEDGIDLGHVLVSIDMELSFHVPYIIDNIDVSWAGDLGSAVSKDVNAKTTLTPIGTKKSLANMPDILGDIDGDNIAKHMQSEHALDAIIDYYRGTSIDKDGVNIKNRYRTFANDLNLLDNNGNIKYNAANTIINKGIIGFIKLNNLGRFLLWPPWAMIQHVTKLREISQIAAKQFVDIISKGIKKEGEP
jgi:hypothetical protein